MTEIIAEAGHITGLGSEISSKIISGLPPGYAKLVTQRRLAPEADEICRVGRSDGGPERGRSDHRPVQLR
jgi:hypothetical protein